MEYQAVQSSLKPFWWRIFPASNNITICVLWKRILLTGRGYKVASWTYENQNGNVQYYYKVEFNFPNDW